MWKHLSCGTALVVMAGCAAHRFEVERVSPPSLGREFVAFTAPVDPIPPAENVLLSVGKVLSLDDALALALVHSPELAAFSYEIRAREAAALQAGVLPNPEVGLDVENFGGRGAFNGADSAETTLLLSQLIELRGKRGKRMRVAAYAKKLADWDYEGKRLDVLSGATRAFVRVLAAQESLSLRSELLELSQKVKNAVAARVEAGKVSPIEAIKAEVALSSALLGLDQAKRALVAARYTLAAFWGTSPEYETVTGSLTETGTLPSLESLQPLIGHNPDVARWLTEMRRGKAELDLTKAGRIPDVTLKGGIRQLRDEHAETFVVGVSFPLPFFNRNQGNIRQAQYHTLKAEAQATGALNKATASLVVSYQSLSAALASVVTLKERILPSALLAFNGMKEGYREGKFGFLDVLDAQRTLFAAKGQYIEALTNYHLFKTEVERLIGKNLTSISERQESGDEG